MAPRAQCLTCIPDSGGFPVDQFVEPGDGDHDYDTIRSSSDEAVLVEEQEVTIVTEAEGTSLFAGIAHKKGLSGPRVLQRKPYTRKAKKQNQKNVKAGKKQAAATVTSGHVAPTSTSASPMPLEHAVPFDPIMDEKDPATDKKMLQILLAKGSEEVKKQDCSGKRHDLLWKRWQEIWYKGKRTEFVVCNDFNSWINAVKSGDAMRRHIREIHPDIQSLRTQAKI